MQPLDHLVPYFDSRSEEELKQQWPLEKCLSNTSQKINALVQELKSLTQSHTPEQKNLLQQMTGLQSQLQNCLEIKKINQIIRDVNIIYDKFQATVNPQDPIDFIGYLPIDIRGVLLAEIGNEHLINGGLKEVNSFLKKETLEHVKHSHAHLYQKHLEALKNCYFEQKKLYENIKHHFQIFSELRTLIDCSHSVPIPQPKREGAFNQLKRLEAFNQLKNYPKKNLVVVFDALSQFLNENESNPYLYEELRNIFKAILDQKSFFDDSNFWELSPILNFYITHMIMLEQTLTDLNSMINRLNSLSQDLVSCENWSDLSKKNAELNTLFYGIKTVYLQRFALNPFSSISVSLPVIKEVSDFNLMIGLSYYNDRSDFPELNIDEQKKIPTLQSILNLPAGPTILAALIDTLKLFTVKHENGFLSTLSQVYFATEDVDFKQKIACAILLVDDPGITISGFYHSATSPEVKSSIALDLIRSDQSSLLFSALTEINQGLISSIIDELLKTDDVKIRSFVDDVKKHSLLPKDRIDFYRVLFDETLVNNHAQFRPLQTYKNDHGKNLSHEGYLAEMKKKQHRDEFVDQYYVYLWTFFQLIKNPSQIEEGLNFAFKHGLTQVEVFDRLILDSYPGFLHLNSILDLYFRFIREGNVPPKNEPKYWICLHKFYSKVFSLENFDFSQWRYQGFFNAPYHPKTIDIDQLQSINIQLRVWYASAADSTLELIEAYKMVEEGLRMGKNFLVSPKIMRILSKKTSISTLIYDQQLLKINHQLFSYVLLNASSFQANLATTLAIYEELGIAESQLLRNYSYENLSMDRFLILIDAFLNTPFISPDTIEALLTGFITAQIFSKNFTHQDLFEQLGAILQKYPQLRMQNNEVFESLSCLRSEKELDAYLAQLPHISTYLPPDYEINYEDDEELELLDSNVLSMEINEPFVSKIEHYSWIAFAIYQTKGFESFSEFLIQHHLFTENLYQLAIRHQSPETALERLLWFTNQFEIQENALTADLLSNPLFDASLLAKNPSILNHLAQSLDRHRELLDNKKITNKLLSILSLAIDQVNPETFETIQKIISVFDSRGKSEFVLKDLIAKIFQMTELSDLQLDLLQTVFKNKNAVDPYFAAHILQFNLDYESLNLLKRAVNWISLLDLPKALIFLCLDKMIQIYLYHSSDPLLPQKLIAQQQDQDLPHLIPKEDIRTYVQQSLDTKGKPPHEALQGLEYALTLIELVRHGNWPLDIESLDLSQLFQQMINHLDTQEFRLADQYYCNFILEKHQDLIASLSTSSTHKRKRNSSEDNPDLPPLKKQKK